MFKLLGPTEDSMSCQKIRKIFLSCVEKDCLDLPDKTFVKRTVELTDEQKQLYISMKIAAMAELKDKNHEHHECNYTIDEATSNYLWSLQG